MKKEYTELFNKISNASVNGNPLVAECIDILNFRIEQEELSSRLYHSMSMWLNNAGYINAAAKWQKDADDEMEHASWAKDFLLDMGVNPKIPALNEPKRDFTGFPDIIKETYAHEVLVTKQCNDLANFAMKAGNHLLYQLAFKYMKEQQEEIGRSNELLSKLETFGEDKIALKLLDNEFAPK